MSGPGVILRARPALMKSARVDRSGTEIDLQPFTCLESALEHYRCSRHIFECSTSAVEYRDLLRRSASRSPPAHDIGQLGVNSIASHYSRLERVVKITNGGALFQHVY